MACFGAGERARGAQTPSGKFVGGPGWARGGGSKCGIVVPGGRGFWRGIIPHAYRPTRGRRIV
eukprot:4641702-Pyramimonas_sp.AAC.1